MKNRFHLPLGVAAAVVGMCATFDAASLGAARAQDQAPATEQAAPANPLVEKGRYLATAGNCVSCHTRPGGGEPFAGGVAFKTDFGTIYSTNITPDTEAGIGGWTEEQFVRAMHEGVDDEGTPLYPAFPYTSFTLVTDEDAKAIFAYLRSLKPVKYTAPQNEMSFPFNQRVLLKAWNALFFKPGRYAAVANQSAEWNRGAYLVEGLGHCGACHSPRNFLGGQSASTALTGGTYMDAVEGGEIRPWSAVNLTSASTGLGAWAVEDIKDYLKTGHGARAGTLGPMNEVITNSLQNLTDEDVKAMAVYIKSLPANERVGSGGSQQQMSAGEVVYTIRCGTCHLPTGMGSIGITTAPGGAQVQNSDLAPPLATSAVVQAPDPASLINVILYGARVPTPAPPGAWKDMKAFGNELSDEEVANLATYVRGTWGNKGSAVSADTVGKQR